MPSHHSSVELYIFTTLHLAYSTTGIAFHDPSVIVDTSSVNSFKWRLDEFWNGKVQSPPYQHITLQAQVQGLLT